MSKIDNSHKKWTTSCLWSQNLTETLILVWKFSIFSAVFGRKLFPLFAPYINTQLENSMGNKTQITTLWRYLMIHYYHSTNIQLTPCKVENVNKNNGSMRVSYEWIWNQISAASGPCCKWAWKLNGATLIQNEIIQFITVYHDW